MAKYTYRCVFTYYKEEDVWIAEFPAFDETTICGVTDGKSWGEVKYMAHDLLSLMVMCAEDHGTVLPDDSDNAVINAERIGSAEFRPTRIIPVTIDTDAYRKAVEQYKRVRRYRMAERARRRYLYPVESISTGQPQIEFTYVVRRR